MSIASATRTLVGRSMTIRRLAANSPAIRRFAASATGARKLLDPLPDRFRSPLLSMYAEEPQMGRDGDKHTLDGSTKISPAQGMWIYELCRARKPANTLEIGVAY